jgi:lipopolysaccharide export system permease protein
MRILDRYIIRQVWQIFILCTLTFAMLFVIVDLFTYLDVILKQHIAAKVFMRYYLSYMPFVFTQISPFACLLAILYTFSRLNHDNELIAMRASGMSIFQVTRTVVIFGVLVSGFVFIVGDKIMPQAMYKNSQIREQLDSGKKIRAKDEVIRNLSIYGVHNRLYFINKFHPGKGLMEGITILEHDEKQNLTSKIQANQGKYENGKWIFYQSITYVFDEEGQMTQEPRVMDREEMSIPETPKEFLEQRQSTDFMSLNQIRDYIRKLAPSGAVTVIRNMQVDFYHRLFSPLTSLLIILLGVPLSMKIGKRAAGLSSLGLALVLGFMYYVLNAISVALGKAGIFDPLLAGSLAHMCALAASIFLVARQP